MNRSDDQLHSPLISLRKTTRRNNGSRKRKRSRDGSPQKIINLNAHGARKHRHSWNPSCQEILENTLQEDFPGFTKDSVLREMCEKYLKDLRSGLEPSIRWLDGESLRRDSEQKIDFITEELKKAFSLNGIEPQDPAKIKSMYKIERLASDVQALWSSVKPDGAALKPKPFTIIPDFVNPIVPLKFDTGWEHGFPVVFTNDAPPSPLCLLCGSAGIDEMLYCSTCCEPFHLYCVNEDPRLWDTTPCIESGRNDSVVDCLWSCKRCWLCNKCGLKDNVNLCDNSLPDEIFRCGECLETFHYKCSGKNYFAAASLYSNQEVTFLRWLCDDCVKCKSCNMRFDSASHDKKFIRKHPEENSAVCKNCFKQIKKGSYCPVCNSAYDDNDYETRMLECGKCERWIHAACEDITEEQYQIISFLPNCADFACSLCETGRKISAWKLVVGAYISEGWENILGRFAEVAVLHFKEIPEEYIPPEPFIPNDAPKLPVNALSPEKRLSSIEQRADFIEELRGKNRFLQEKEDESLEDIENNQLSSENGPAILSWSPSKQKILKSIENSSFSQNLNPVSVFPGRNRLEERQIIVKKFAEFIENLKGYKLIHPVTSSCFSVVNLFTVSKASITTFCKEEIEELPLRDAIIQDFKDSLLSVFSWCKDQMLVQKLPVDADKSVDMKPPAKPGQLHTCFWDAVTRVDIRQCKFCGAQGDLNPEGPGRLLWAGFSEWVHVNCALWSCEVWEDEHGGLHQVHNAVFRGKSKRCKLCHNLGATVSCCRSSCKDSYHFLCAIRSGCSMRKDLSVYCKSHRTLGESQAEFRVSRRVYVADSSFRKKENLISSESVKVIIGSLRIDSLGTLNSASTVFSSEDKKSYLLSAGLNCQRVYWSLENPCNLDIYKLQTCIDRSFEKRIATVSADDHIVIDHEATTRSESDNCELKLRAFRHWTDTAPVYIDECGRDWLLLSSASDGEESCKLHCNSIQRSSSPMHEELFEGYSRFHDYASSLLSLLQLDKDAGNSRSSGLANNWKFSSSEQFLGSSSDNRDALSLPESVEDEAKEVDAKTSETNKHAPVHCSLCRRTYTTSEGYSLHISLDHCFEYSSGSDCTTLVSSDAEEITEDSVTLDSGPAQPDLCQPSCQWSASRAKSSKITSPSPRCVIRASLLFRLNSRGSVLLNAHKMSDVGLFMINELQKKRARQIPSLSSRHFDHSTSLTLLNFAHPAVQFLLEQLPGNEYCVGKHQFVYQRSPQDPQCEAGNSSGVARFESYTTRKPFDMFGWLASKHRTLQCIDEGYVEGSQQDLPVAMRYRNLKEKTCQSLYVYYSEIHGRGLFTRRPIQEGELIIEYAGELIRTVLADVREKRYESKGIGCYFFTIDEKLVVDATMKGSAARFINHSCEPNCKSKVVDILGKKKILIFADRKILGGEELTYDYKFAFESEDKKLLCRCRARRCRKYMN